MAITVGTGDRRRPDFWSVQEFLDGGIGVDSSDPPP